MFVCLSASNNSASTGRVLIKLDVWACFENLSLKSDKSNEYFTLRRFHVWQYLAKFFWEWEMIRQKLQRKSKHILCSRTFFSRNCTVCEIMSKNMVETKGPQITSIWRMRVACWKTKATCMYAHAHPHSSGYPHALIHAHARPHKLISNSYCFSTATVICERTSVLRYTYIATPNTI
jgi:hypothetical protein